MKRLFSILIFSIFIIHSAFAYEVEVPVNQAKMEINGAVCAYCAYGMQKSLSKKGYIDKTKGHKGVESDIDNQIITLYLQEGKTIELNEVNKSIIKSGYEPRAFHLRVQGTPIKDGEKIFLIGVDNKRLFELVGDKAIQLTNDKNYDLQLLVDEAAIGMFKENQPPQAQIKTILTGE